MASTKKMQIIGLKGEPGESAYDAYVKSGGTLSYEDWTKQQDPYILANTAIKDTPVHVISKTGTIVTYDDLSYPPELEGLTIIGATRQDGVPDGLTPYPIHGVGDDGKLGVRVTGKNLLDKVRPYVGAYSRTIPHLSAPHLNIVPNFPYVALDKALDKVFGIAYVVPCAAGQTYTLSITDKATEILCIGMAEYTDISHAVNTDNSIGHVGLWDGRQLDCYNYTAKGNGILVVLVSNQYDNNEAILTFTGEEKLQVELGASATAYEPYCGSVATITTGLPLFAQSEAADRITRNRDTGWRAHKYFGRVVYDGTEEWVVDGKFLANGADYYYTIRAKIADAPSTNHVQLMCSHYTSNYVANSQTLQGVDIVWGNIRVRWGEEMPVEAWKTYLADQYAAGTPLTVVYPLVEPHAIALTAEESAALDELTAYAPTTVIANDAWAQIEVEAKVTLNDAIALVPQGPGIEIVDAVSEMTDQNKTYALRPVGSFYQYGADITTETTVGWHTDGFGYAFNPLAGKKLVCTGDSITLASHVGKGYAHLIAERNGMELVNVAINGAVTPTGVIYNGTEVPSILTTLAVMPEDADYVILSGGINDYGHIVNERETLGALSAGYGATLDEGTYIGALETMFKTALLKWEGKKILYVLEHNISDTQITNHSHLIAALEKWGIPYVDLSKTTAPIGRLPQLYQKYTFNGDTLHPTVEGYRKFYVSHIESKLKEI